MYTTKEAAEILGIKAGSVKTHCQRHKDIGVKIGRDWLLTDEDLVLISEKRRKHENNIR